MRAAAFLLALAFSLPASAAELVGTVVKVADGDTITVLDANKVQHRVRLLGIDAPETKQAFSAVSKGRLGEFVHEKRVRVEWSEKDRYGRVLGDVRVGGTWVNREMVAEGLAWHYTQYDDRAELAKAEADARAARRGLWADKSPTPPWQWRKEKREQGAGK